MKRIGYWAFLLLTGVFSILPFRAIYAISDFLSFIFKYIVPYRKAMIIGNLQKAFPDKSELEIKEITNNFYANLGDLVVEAIKGFTMSAEEIKRRYRFPDTSLVDKYMSQGMSVIGSTAHLTNWEWGSNSIGISIDYEILGVYKKVTHPFINDYLVRSRSRFNVKLLEMRETKEYIERRKEAKPYLLMLIADQRPSNPLKAYWTIFLNKESAFMRGMESIALQHKLPVLFFNINRIKRGFYEVGIEELYDGKSVVESGKILEAYKNVLEREILKRPGDWLWSHSRWKHPRPETMQLRV